MGNNRGKKNRHVITSGSVSDGGGGGNGIAGLVVFVGALAVAGFIAVASFAIKKNRTKGAVTEPNPKPKPKQVSLDNGCKKQNDHEIETTQGLGALRQPSTTPTNEGDAACHGTADTKSINHACIPEEKIDPVPDLNSVSEVARPTRFHHQEIVFSDDSHPESAASSHGSGIEEECLASLINSHGSQAQDVEVEPQESPQSIETETQDDDIVSGEDSSSKSILNTNEKPVFSPAQQDFKGEGEGERIDIQNEAHGAAKAETGATKGAVTVTPEATSNEKGNFSVVLNDQPSAPHSFQLTTWVMPVLLLALLFYFCLSIVHHFFSSIIP